MAKQFAAGSEPTSLMYVCTYTHIYIQNYWGFELFPSSGILGNRGHNVSETGSLTSD
jgi:hypothetical protein